MKKRISLMLLIACMLFSATGCSDDETRSSLLGSWRFTSEGETTTEIDLNRDGVDEVITYEIKENGREQGYTKNVLLKVNDAEYEVECNSPIGTLAFAALSDDQYTILVGDEGLSEHYSTQFFNYDGENIIKIGETGGICTYEGFGEPGQLNVDGEGTVTAPERADIVQSWDIEMTYKLVDGKLQLVEEDFYKAFYATATLIDYDFYASPDMSAEKVSIKAGTEVRFIGTDNKEWTQMAYLDENGEEQIAYFRVTNFYLVDGDENLTTEMLFKDLVFAD